MGRGAPCCWGTEDGTHPATAHLCQSILDESGPKKKRRIHLLQELSSYREGSWAKAGISPSSKDPLWEGLRRGEAEPLKVHKAVRMVSVWPL